MLPVPFDRLPSNASSLLNVTRGQLIFRQAVPTFAMFFLEQGAVELQRHTEDGEKLVVHRVSPGETFAEASLFSNVYHCDASASEAGIVRRIDRQAVLKLFEKDPDFARALTARFATQVQSYRRRIEVLAINSAKKRVYAAILDGMMRGSVMALAADIGLTHESVYRALSDLVADGLLERVARGRYRPT